MKNEIFDIPIEAVSKSTIREKIKKYLFQSDGKGDLIHIVSLNAENIIIAERDRKFRQVLATAQIKITDSVGVALAGRLLGVDVGERIAGVDLMEDFFDMASYERLRIVLIGGKKKVAERVVQCQKQRHPDLNCIGIEGIADIHKPTAKEEKNIYSIVLEKKPNLVFVAFGSPFQELWIDRHRDLFHGMVCMGVGGAFDYLSYDVPRAPRIVIRIGGEWIFRLCIQPWRIRRQLRLFSFIILVAKKYFLLLFKKISS
ncbi:MAG TPA: WecB/TagA/CpsF family glycosyltransferase [Patescibacteria group bacterium]|nr:WecB/TagA/CpsF family glycosyltransferase [Patescibacteria group bacterium]